MTTFLASAQTNDSLTRNLPLWNPIKTKQFIFERDSILIDSLTLVSGSLSVIKNGELQSADCYNISGNYITLNKECFLRGDSLEFRYRTIGLNLKRPQFNKNRKLIGEETNLGEDFVIGQGYTYNPFAQNQDFNDFKGLDYSGSFSRGISVGNRQDLILNSGFNLQVGGKIGDVEVSGAISDNNIPLQPEGNTQQLQDFDRIFLQFKLKKSFLTAGDYDLKRPEGSYFLNYYRRLQGAQAGTAFKVGNGQMSTDASFAISRGTFTRNIFDGQEGNQGPYRLKGANGEIFIIIIAGTERLFMDGELLTRGADFDYIIDYNLGEIIFTNKRLITKDKRIQVEFSYSDLDYLRTVNTFNVGFKEGRNQYRINWYSEQDAKNQPATQFQLTDSARAVLRRVGNDIDNAVIWGASIPDENNLVSGLVKYRMIDSLVNGILYDSVFVYSTQPDSTLYTVRFSQIAGGGNYIRLNNAINGTVFSWISPDSLTGLPRGTHEPLILLATPKKRQMLNVGTDYKLGKNGLIQADIAISNRDLNTFSKVGNADNQGIAARLSWQHRVKLREHIVSADSQKTKKSITDFVIAGHYEFVQDRFETVEPYRPREFQRDWTISTTQKTNEHLFSAKLGLENKNWGNIAYEFGGLLRDSVYNGFRHLINADVRSHGFTFNALASYLSSESSEKSSQFLRPRFDLSYSIKNLNKLKLGVYFEQEQNKIKSAGSDTLNAASFYFNVFKVYAELPANEGFMLRASGLRRYDYFIKAANFSELTVADELNFGGEWKSSKISQLQWNLNYRNLRISDTTKTSLDPKETYLGRVEYNLNIRKGLLRLNTIYELGAGQQQKLAYNYVQVDKGMGTHVWFDRNEDGVQQQNEFEQAVFADQADFIRVSILTNEFIRSDNVLFSQSMDFEPSVLFKKAKKGQKTQPWAWLGKFSSRSLFKIERKTLANADVLAFNPFQLDVADTSLISIGSGIRNIIYFNRSETKFRVEFQQSDQRNKTLLNIGFDSRRRSDYSLMPSLKLNDIFRTQFSALYGFNENFSQFFPDRDYSLEIFELKPQLIYMNKTIFRTSLQYKYKESRNRIGNEETAKSHDITIDAKYSNSGKKSTSIRLSFSWVNLAFDGQNNTPVQFAMTEGLLNGQNYLWTLNIDRSISKNIQLNIGYEGRKIGAAQVVHVGRAQVRAVF
jgi:hypothetical protein